MRSEDHSPSSLARPLTIAPVVRVVATCIALLVFLAGCTSGDKQSSSATLKTTSTTENSACRLIGVSDIEDITGEQTLPAIAKDEETGATRCLFGRKSDPGTLVASVELEPSSVQFYLFKKTQKTKIGDAEEVADADLEGYFDTRATTLSVLVGRDQILIIKDHLSKAKSRIKSNAEKMAQIALKNLGADSTPGSVLEDSDTTTTISQTAKTQIEKDVLDHLILINAFWGEQFKSNASLKTKGTWKDVTKVNALGHNAKAKCGFGSGSLVTNNAFYCGLDNSVTYDTTFFNNLAEGDTKQTRVWTVLAHELGHAVQDNANLDFERSSALEMQADCFAGVFIGTENETGKIALDVEIAAEFIEALGDPDEVSEDDPQAHGTGPERRSAFLKGISGTPQTCLNGF